jgi:salicylate 5-hydroxylase large subunit
LDDSVLGLSNSAARQWPEGGLSRVPYWIYTDAEVYLADQERIFCGPSW